MSACAQNVAYVYGKKKPNVKVNVLSKEKLDKLEKEYGKYLNKERHETKT